MSIQKQIMNDLHVKPSIDPKQEIEDRVNFLKQYLKKQVPKALCSASAAGRIPRLRDASPNWRLKASEKKAETRNLSPSVFRTAQQDEDDAQLALKFIKPDKSWTFDIKSAVSAFADQYKRHGRSAV